MLVVVRAVGHGDPQVPRADRGSTAGATSPTATAAMASTAAATPASTRAPGRLRRSIPGRSEPDCAGLPTGGRCQAAAGRLIRHVSGNATGLPRQPPVSGVGEAHERPLEPRPEPGLDKTVDQVGHGAHGRDRRRQQHPLVHRAAEQVEQHEPVVGVHQVERVRQCARRRRTTAARAAG